MTYDAIIVGAGPAGLSTALFLRHHRPEARLLVLERKRFPRDKFCAGAVGGRADRLLATIGVEVNVPSVPLAGIRMTVPKGAPQSVPGHVGRTVRRREFDAALAAEVRDRGITLIEEAPVRDLERTGTGVGVVAGGETFSARAVVGADGVGSFVRRWLGLPFSSLKARVVEVDSERVPTDPPPDILHFDVSDRGLRGYAWDFPTPLEGRTMMSRGVYALTFRGEEAPPVGELLDLRLRRMGLDPSRCRKKQMAERGFEPHRPFGSRRVLLVGEAAGVDPLTGEGIAQAIQYGSVAGRYLAEKLACNDFGFADWRDRLLRSPVGADLFARRWAANLCFCYARRPMEVLFARVPGLLDVATRLFAGSLRRRPV